MIRCFIFAILLLFCHLEACIAREMKVKKSGEDLYISAKLDSETDILYQFKKCMFNELFTFYKVETVANDLPYPVALPYTGPTTILNQAYSDNIGPLNIAGRSWCGGNHSYQEDGKTKTARNSSVHIYIDGKEIKEDTSALAKKIEIRVVNEILNPANPITNNGIISLNDTLCIETVDYSIQRNSIQVSVALEFCNESQVVVQRYCGMQSMFEGETEILTPSGKYENWTPVADVTRFTKKEYPLFRRFVEKRNTVSQSSYLLKKGLGNHAGISDDHFIFIGNSFGKSYHKLIAQQPRKAGDKDFWSGVYTWFGKAIKDDNDALCYEGVIDGKDAIYIDCMRECNTKITLPARYNNREFSIYEKTPGVDVSEQIVDSEVGVWAKVAGGCVLVFNSTSLTFQ